MNTHSLTPYQSKMYNGIPLPDSSSYTGKCLKKTEMVTRGRVEAANCSNLIFITLTYSPERLPLTYSKCKDLPIFRKRVSRKKIKLVDAEKPWKWIEKPSQPLKLDENIFRTKELMNEYDFKNAKTRAKLHYGYDANNPHLGLLVPDHLSWVLLLLREELREYLHDDTYHVRYIANGEYGQHTHRPHYHIVIFDSTDFDYYKILSNYWYYGRILQVKRVAKTDTAIKKLTAYIVGHTAKNDQGNRYQQEMSPAFRIMSSYNGGIGSSLLNFRPTDDPFVNSLSFSLLNWDKRSPLKYEIVDNTLGVPKVFQYEFPRYYKDKVLGYKNLSDRDFWESLCTMQKKCITDFLRWADIHGSFDLLATFSRAGTFETPQDLITFFLMSNYKNLPQYYHYEENIYFKVNEFFTYIRAVDLDKKMNYQKKYSKRHQEKKYLDYLCANHFEVID